MGQACGKDWYYSNVIVGESHKPTCLWMDGDHTNDIWTSAMQIHIQDFTNTTDSGPVKDPGAFCTPPVMNFHHDNPGEYDWSFWREGVQKRHEHKKVASHDGSSVRDPRIISSPHSEHSAQKLCESASSKGPDFVSLEEGIYCDMTTKTHWPLCSDSVSSSCYDWNTHSLVAGRRLMKRNYEEVIEWK